MTAGQHQSGQFWFGQDRSPITNCRQLQEGRFTKSVGQKLHFTVRLHKEAGIYWGLCTLPRHKQQLNTQR